MQTEILAQTVHLNGQEQTGRSLAKVYAMNANHLPGWAE
jgi:hypothetical protein